MSTLEWGPSVELGPAASVEGAGSVEDCFLRQVEETVRESLQAEAARWIELGVPWTDPVNELTSYVTGGKSLRPRFSFWAAQASGGDAEPSDLAKVGAALELLHAFALIHDDLMDQSDTRRGRPALHVRYAAVHGGAHWAGAPDAFGASLALLSGDLAFALANRLVSELPRNCSETWTQLVSELVAGQYVDVAAPARRVHTERVAALVSQLKSSSYSVLGPMQLGAAVQGRELNPSLSRYGSMIGEAFQMRDDLIGVFGDPAITGKPVGDDIRAGKSTPLLVEAHRLTSRDDRKLLERAGDQDIPTPTISAIVQLIDQCGARDEIERRIEHLVADALASLDLSGIEPWAYQGLASLAQAVAFRTK